MSAPSKLSSRSKFQIGLLMAIFSSFLAFGMLYRASSQGDFADTYPKGFRGGACTVETDSLTIGYSGYYLPDDYEAPSNTIRSPFMPVQCGKIPEPGTINISIDLLYPESARDTPLALRLVKVESNEKETSKESEVFSLPAKPHQSGVITQSIKLSEVGQYFLYLDGTHADNSRVQVKVPLNVGLEWRDHLRKLFSTFMKNH
ncbi:hypothetical protein ABF87_06525 [Nitrosomonas sp. JL21]|nr:hypothetical protein [Nitrosomonas sp.]MBL8498397.1 hypothetical protein [Nitrosomonas sp.]MXS77625.1 hypothetical protein [Nitrosomonas sp. JL21]